MASKVEVCNMALGHVGVFNPISDITENSKEAIACRAFFDMARRLVLRDVPWNWATGRKLMASLGDPPSNWAYRYKVPSNCVKPRSIVVPGQRLPMKSYRISFETATEDGVGTVIYTDQPEAELLFTRNVEDLNLWDDTASEALSYLLAAKITMPLAVKPDVAQQALQGYYRVMSTASAHNANEGEEAEAPSEFLGARG